MIGAIGSGPGASVLSPASPFSAAISGLFDLTFWISLAILVAVATAITWFIVRFRHRPGAPPPPQIHGHPSAELVLTGVPLLIVAVVFAVSLHAMTTADPATDGRTPEIVVIGHQWWWEVRYPGSGVVTANEIHIPAGRPVLVELRSADVIHDFWVPELARKIDMTPGAPRRIWLSADSAGIFGGACAEFCGTEHAWMRIRVVADSAAAFQRWLASNAQPQPAAPSDSLVARGRAVFATRSCGACHTGPDGDGGGTDAGPDLAHLRLRATLGAGALDNTPANLVRWIADPDAVKPGVLMPKVDLSSGDLAALVAYLERP